MKGLFSAKGGISSSRHQHGWAALSVKSSFRLFPYYRPWYLHGSSREAQNQEGGMAWIYIGTFDVLSDSRALSAIERMRSAVILCLLSTYLKLPSYIWDV